MNKLTTKRKYISEDLPNSKQRRFKEDKETQRKDVGNDWTINSIINLGMPHIGEKIFSSIDTNELVQWMNVSKPWKVLIVNVLLKRWRDSIFYACKNGKTEVVKILLANLKDEKTDWNARDEDGLTAFAWACKNGHKVVVKLLLEKSGSKIFLRITRRKENAYHWACWNGHANIVKIAHATFK